MRRPGRAISQIVSKPYILSASMIPVPPNQTTLSQVIEGAQKSQDELLPITPASANGPFPTHQSEDGIPDRREKESYYLGPKRS
jgi:hypothetical protein